MGETSQLLLEKLSHLRLLMHLMPKPQTDEKTFSSIHSEVPGCSATQEQAFAVEQTNRCLHGFLFCGTKYSLKKNCLHRSCSTTSNKQSM